MSLRVDKLLYLFPFCDTSQVSIKAQNFYKIFSCFKNTTISRSYYSCVKLGIILCTHEKNKKITQNLKSCKQVEKQPVDIFHEHKKKKSTIESEIIGKKMKIFCMCLIDEINFTKKKLCSVFKKKRVGRKIIMYIAWKKMHQA